MISLIIISLLLYCVVGNGVAIYPSLFEDFKIKYRKNYGSAEEEKRRKEIFMSNMAKAEEMNRANPYAHFGMNKFADLTDVEFKSTHHNGEKYYKNKQALRLLNKNVITYTEEEVSSSCTSIDWRKKGAVTAVKDQGRCSSYWAFSTTGNIEGQWFTAGHPLVSLSEQELVSCDTNDRGCDGGLINDAFQWLINYRKGQIVKESSLPYASGNSHVPSCPANLNKLTVGAQIKGFRDIAHDEDQMATFVCKSGPLSISVDATSWHSYSTGIMTKCVSKTLDHGVLAVGFDKNNKPPYWIIKNSWGSDWGEDGYIRIEYGSNQCLINKGPTTSIIGTTPAPTNTTTTSPKPTHTLHQKHCKDEYCSEDCHLETYPLYTCIPTSGSSSTFIKGCEGNSVDITEYPTSNSCTGASYSNDMPLGQCLQEDSGSLQNFCYTTFSSPLSLPKKLSKLRFHP